MEHSQQRSQQLCVSIYMPIYFGKNHHQYNKDRFKNLIRQTEELLGAYRRNSAIALNVLQPVLTLLNDVQFWQHQNQGFAIFLAEGMMRYYHLPLMLEELVVVENRFHLKPLKPMMNQIAVARKVKRYFAAM